LCRISRTRSRRGGSPRTVGCEANDHARDCRPGRLALAKAARHAIKTITPGEITPEFVGKVVNNADQAQYTHWVTYPQKGEVVITSGGDSQQIELPPNFSIFYADGSVATTFEVLASFVTRHHTRTHEDQWEEVLGKRHVAVGDSPEPRYNGQKVYIQGVSTSTGQEELFEIANVIVTFHAERTMAVVPLTHGEFDGTYYSTGTAPPVSTTRCRWSGQKPPPANST
jgi:hypothetical protein